MSKKAPAEWDPLMARWADDEFAILPPPDPAPKK